MNLYENVIIGNFIYMLGLKVGQKLKRNISIINLLQQTPADPVLGDLFVEYPGVVRLIEFKNSKSSKEKEKSKLGYLKISLNANKELIPISKEIHWYIETEPLNTKCYNKIIPYIKAFDNTHSDYNMEDYIDDIVNNIDSEIEDEKMTLIAGYLNLLKGLSNTSIGTGGLIVNVSDKGVKYVQITDFSQLRLQQKEFIELVEKQYESIMKNFEVKEKDIEVNKKRDHFRGLNL